MAATFTDEGMKLMWIPADAAITGTIDALKIADFAVTSVVDLSDFAVVGGCEFVETEPDTIDLKVYSDKGKTTIPTLSNYSGKGQFLRDRDNTGVLSANDVLAVFENRAQGWIVKRPGRPEAIAWTAVQDYEYFLYTATYIATINDADGGYEMVEVGFLPKGDHGWGAVAAA